MIKYKLTHTYYDKFFFWKVGVGENYRFVEIKTESQKEEIERFFSFASTENEFKWEFISKTYKLTDCGV